MRSNLQACDQLALHGGRPVREKMLPYGKQLVEEDDIKAVSDALRSDWLTTGPRVAAFEESVAAYVGAARGVAVNSGTAALHAAMFAIGVGSGDEVIVPPMTFAATANCVLFQGATPVFADVTPGELCLDPKHVMERITPRTKAVVAVDYAGQPCNYDVLRQICREHGLFLVADACHALGAKLSGACVGTMADLTVFSFHPVKHIATGEGGMVVTNDDALAQRMISFRSHGVEADFRQRQEQGSWIYEMHHLGFNYRLTDMQCALGLSQLSKLDRFLSRRRAIAARYSQAFTAMPGVRPLDVRPDVEHAWHLYVVRFDLARFSVGRADIFAALRAEGIGVNVHYIPVHYHPYYRERLGMGPGLCPVAEGAYEEIVTLPIFPGMTDEDIEDVVCAVAKVMHAFCKV